MLPTTESIHPIRASLARLPKHLQPFFTWLTAYALPGQQPLIPLTSAAHLILSATRLFLYVVVGLVLAHQL
jgi:hypothetical protein